MKWWQNFLRRIAKYYLENNRQPIEDATMGLVDAALFEAAVEIKKKIPELPDSVLLAMREEVEKVASEKVEKAIDELLRKLSEE